MRKRMYLLQVRREIPTAPMPWMDVVKFSVVRPPLLAIFHCTKMSLGSWASEGGGRRAKPPMDFEIISKKKVVFQL